MHVYVYDGTTEGFYSAVFDAYKDKDAYLTCDELQLSLTDKIFSVATDGQKSERVRKKLTSIDPYTEKRIQIALKSGSPEKSQTVFEFLKFFLQNGKNSLDMLSRSCVLDFELIVKKILFERERMLGFLRFSECANGILYAAYSPDNDVTEIILPHFLNRLRNERFVIHDVKRGKAALYNGATCIFIDLDKAEIELSEREIKFAELWQAYYQDVNISDRKHIGQMKRSMPVRYWKFMNEKHSAP